MISRSGLEMRTPSFPVGRKEIGEGHSCFVIADVAQAHDGSLGLAHSFIDAAAKCGVDAVKFQTHIAAAESTPDEPWRVKFSLQDATRYDYWKRMEFSREQWGGLKTHAETAGLTFLSSPFSNEAVELLDNLGIDAWKIASGEINNGPMFEALIALRKPILLSTGMSPVNEVDLAVDRLKARNVPMCVMQCTSAYPCPAEKVGINLIPFFRDRYQCAVGLSDHSGKIYAGLAAAVLGIQVLEVHLTLSREMFGPDVAASLTPEELRQLVEGVRFIEAMTKSPVDKDRIATEVAPLRKMFTKSIVAKIDLTAGTIIRREHLAVKKPGTGLAPEYIRNLIGRRLIRNVNENERLHQDDIEGEI